ncbi:hypothetical protein [Streptomyces violascens]|uniref:Uncharacterized protein n=1 Tax=Streptomyces violascens TaxID=67381 RepID=A0ABQ3QZL0_9ACTN|nr:hypothetical protein [Streptomyces violascens]GGU15668.1 hypothetical protein GCM10010289_41850 [Streptomyces violascens]GHI42712.1 hypothetical protein Sviol_71200 [Streptomyces violascens]
MDTELRKLADHLRKRGLHVDLDDTGSLRATNSVNDLAEHIAMNGNHYVTPFGYEIGERGHEASCAERIAHMLAAPVQTGLREDAP